MNYTPIMLSHRIIATVISIALLLGQWGAMLHALEHIPAGQSVVHTDHSHAEHEHKGHAMSLLAAASFTNGALTAVYGGADEGVDPYCLVYHLHGGVQAWLPASLNVPLPLHTVAAETTGSIPAAVDTTIRAVTIRGPPAIS